MNTFHYNLEKPDRKDLENFLTEVDTDFPTPISAKTPITDYVKKVLDKADIWSCIYDEELAGISIFYCNDSNSLMAYESLLSVKKEFRGKGVAEILIKKTLDFIRAKQFKGIFLFTENPIALKLYKKMGFKVTENIGAEKFRLEYIF